MVAENLKQEPLPRQLLWAGEIRRTKWKVYCVAVIHPIEKALDDDELDESELTISTDPFWVLRFESQGNESFETRWCPHDRIIFGTLPGWPRAVIGDLKNALIQHRWQASKEREQNKPGNFVGA